MGLNSFFLVKLFSKPSPLSSLVLLRGLVSQLLFLLCPFASLLFPNLLLISKVFPLSLILYMKHLILKDRRRRILFSLFERRRLVLRSILENSALSKPLRFSAQQALQLLPRDSSPTRRRNRCTLTGRSRGILRRFGLSRLRFRSRAYAGRLPGVRKAIW